MLHRISKYVSLCDSYFLTVIKCVTVSFREVLGGCPLSGKSSMCMKCLKYRIILLIVIKNQ